MKRLPLFCPLEKAMFDKMSHTGLAIHLVTRTRIHNKGNMTGCPWDFLMNDTDAIRERKCVEFLSHCGCKDIL
jgi:hypothetical protein